MVSSKNKTNKIINALGIYVLVSVVINLTYNISKFQEYQQILWYCDIIAIILGIALLKKHTPWISAILLMSIATQGRWIVDFFLELAGIGAGRTAMMLNWGVIDTILSVNLHSIIIPISLYATIKLGFSKKSLLWSLLVVFTLLPITFFATDIDDNMNCVFYPCDEEYDDTIPYDKSLYYNYLAINVLGFWTITFIASYLLFKFMFKNNMVHHKKNKSPRHRRAASSR